MTILKSLVILANNGHQGNHLDTRFEDEIEYYEAFENLVHFVETDRKLENEIILLNKLITFKHMTDIRVQRLLNIYNLDSSSMESVSDVVKTTIKKLLEFFKYIYSLLKKLWDKIFKKQKQDSKDSKKNTQTLETVEKEAEKKEIKLILNKEVTNKLDDILKRAIDFIINVEANYLPKLKVFKLDNGALESVISEYTNSFDDYIFTILSIDSEIKNNLFKETNTTLNEKLKSDTTALSLQVKFREASLRYIQVIGELKTLQLHIEDEIKKHVETNLNDILKLQGYRQALLMTIKLLKWSENFRKSILHPIDNRITNTTSKYIKEKIKQK